jgi:hypothetical protein
MSLEQRSCRSKTDRGSVQLRNPGHFLEHMRFLFGMCDVSVVRRVAAFQVGRTVSRNPLAERFEFVALSC